MKTAPTPQEYYRWLMKLSLPNMRCADFVQIVHNMFERQRAVSVLYLQAKV